MKPLRTIKLNGKRWRITRDKRHAGDDRDWNGYCFHEKHTIYINPAISGNDLLEAAIHEGLHAQLPIIEEAALDRIAISVARLVARLGFTDNPAN